MKKYFKFFLIICGLLFGSFASLYLYNLNKTTVKECADRNLIKKILESLYQEQQDKQNINIKKVFYYDLPETKEFLCGYLVEAQKDKVINKFVVFSDRQVNIVFIGDIIDIKNRKIVGYEELMQDRFLGQNNGTDRN